MRRRKKEKRKRRDYITNMIIIGKWEMVLCDIPLIGTVLYL